MKELTNMTKKELLEKKQDVLDEIDDLNDQLEAIEELISKK